MASSNPLPPFKRQAAANTSIAELQRLAGITVASMEAVRRDDVEGPGRSDLLTRGVEGPMRSDLLTELRMTERAERFTAKVGDRVRGTFGDEGSIVALEPHHTGRGQTLVVKFDNGKQMKVSPGDVTFLRSEAEPDDPDAQERAVADAMSEAEVTLDELTLELKDAAQKAASAKNAFGDAAADEQGASEMRSVVRGIENSMGYADKALRTLQGQIKRIVQLAAAPEPPEESRRSMRRLANLQERATARKSADPEWMKMALKIAGIYNDVTDQLGLDSKPTGDAATAVKVFFTYKVEKEFGNQIPIEVYYEFEDANYHSANEFLDKMGLFDAPYGERQDQWKQEREGIKPMWDR